MKEPNPASEWWPPSGRKLGHTAKEAGPVIEAQQLGNLTGGCRLAAEVALCDPASGGHEKIVLARGFHLVCAPKFPPDLSRVRPFEESDG